MVEIEKQRVFSDNNGYFELNSVKDSVLLSISYLGHLPLKISVPNGGYIGDIHLKRSPVLDTMTIRYGSTPCGISGGRILDENREPVEGASVIIAGKDLPVKVLTSDQRGSFSTNMILGSDHKKSGKNNIYTDLDVMVPRHKPFDYRFRRIDKPSKRAKHDGLIIEIHFYE
jgi:hypothetical protein